MADAPYPFEQAPVMAAPAGPSAAAPGRWRHPLGLPAGSVRALLILMVMGTIWTLLLMPKEKGITVPIYLYYLLFLTAGSYFGSRSRPALPSLGFSEPPPLYLPRGTIRGLVVLGFIGVIGFAIYKDPSGFFSRPLIDQKDSHATLVLPVTMIGSFLLGIIVALISHKVLVGPEGMPAWYQDVLAWVSVLAVLGLGAEVILQLVVFPSMQDPPSLPQMQLILSAIVAFYFGARA